MTHTREILVCVCIKSSRPHDKSDPSKSRYADNMRVCASPGAELAEGLEGGGGHVAERSVVAQQQKGQHLKSEQHKHTLKIAHHENTAWSHLYIRIPGSPGYHLVTSKDMRLTSKYLMTLKKSSPTLFVT